VIVLAAVDVADLVAWISGIDFAQWPQQHRVDDQIRPAMVNDLAWHGFGERTDAFVREALECVAAYVPLKLNLLAYNRMLAVVMPGHTRSLTIAGRI